MRPRQAGNQVLVLSLVCRQYRADKQPRMRKEWEGLLERQPELGYLGLYLVYTWFALCLYNIYIVCKLWYILLLTVFEHIGFMVRQYYTEREDDERMTAKTIIVLQRTWHFNMTRHRVAGSVRGGALLGTHFRFNFVKVKYYDGDIATANHQVGYAQIRGLLKFVDLETVPEGPMRKRSKADGHLAFVARCVCHCVVRICVGVVVCACAGVVILCKYRV